MEADCGFEHLDISDMIESSNIDKASLLMRWSRKSVTTVAVRIGMTYSEPMESFYEGFLSIVSQYELKTPICPPKRCRDTFHT